MPWNLKSRVKRIGVSDWLVAGNVNKAIRPSAAPRSAARRAIYMATTSRFRVQRSDRPALGPWLDSDDLALAVRPPGEMLLGERKPDIETNAEGREDEQSRKHKRHVEGG